MTCFPTRAAIPAGNRLLETRSAECCHHRPQPTVTVSSAGLGRCEAHPRADVAHRQFTGFIEVSGRRRRPVRGCRRPRPPTMDGVGWQWLASVSVRGSSWLVAVLLTGISSSFPASTSSCASSRGDSRSAKRAISTRWGRVRPSGRRCRPRMSPPNIAPDAGPGADHDGVRPFVCGAVVMSRTLDSDISVKVNIGDVRRSVVQIGELSEATGVSTRSLRYYEQQGLLQSHRRANTYREYEPDAIERVAFIQDLFSAGLSSTVIRNSLPLAGDTRTEVDCSALLVRVREVRDALVRQERRLAQRRKTLDSYLAGDATPRGMLSTSPRPVAD